MITSMPTSEGTSDERIWGKIILIYKASTLANTPNSQTEKIRLQRSYIYSINDNSGLNKSFLNHGHRGLWDCTESFCLKKICCSNHYLKIGWKGCLMMYTYRNCRCLDKDDDQMNWFSKRTFSGVFRLKSLTFLDFIKCLTLALRS